MATESYEQEPRAVVLARAYLTVRIRYLAAQADLQAAQDRVDRARSAHISESFKGHSLNYLQASRTSRGRIRRYLVNSGVFAAAMVVSDLAFTAAYSMTELNSVFIASFGSIAAASAVGAVSSGIRERRMSIEIQKRQEKFPNLEADLAAVHDFNRVSWQLRNQVASAEGMFRTSIPGAEYEEDLFRVAAQVVRDYEGSQSVNAGRAIGLDR